MNSEQCASYVVASQGCSCVCCDSIKQMQAHCLCALLQVFSLFVRTIELNECKSQFRSHLPCLKPQLPPAMRGIFHLSSFISCTWYIEFFSLHFSLPFSPSLIHSIRSPCPASELNLLLLHFPSFQPPMRCSYYYPLEIEENGNISASANTSICSSCCRSH